MYEEVEMLKAGEGGFQGGGYVDAYCFLTFRARPLARRRVLSPSMSKQSPFHFYHRMI
jgi:hypothetical protein